MPSTSNGSSSHLQLTEVDTDGLRARECRAVLDDHLCCRERGDLEADIRRNYADDVVILTPGGAHHGHDGVRDSASLLYEAVHHTDGYEYTSIVTDDRVALLEWCSRGDEMQIVDGVDSFLIEDGLIKVQTIRYTVVFADLSQAKSINGN
jgi:hypothetical protein